MKKIFEGIGLFSLICFSFFYTNKVSTVIKENDDILKQIEQIKEQYKNEPIDAIIENDTIIPGLYGSEIDVKKSYNKMKKLNEFNSNLLIYKKIKPNISVKSVYDKYIINGNKNKKEVSLLFLIDSNDKVNDLINILNNYKIKGTFYTDGIWFENNNQKVIDLINEGHIIGNLGYNFNYNVDGISWMNTIVTKIANQKNTYCYNVDNIEYLKICSNNNSYTIRPSIIINDNLLIEIKNNIQNGSIIAIDLNEYTLKQLSLAIEFINSKGLNIVNIEKLLNEELPTK